MADDGSKPGNLVSTDTPYSDAPYGLLTHFRYENADVVWVYTSEHTDLLTIEDMWQFLPQPITYSESLPCPAAPEFKDMATRVMVHILHKKEVPPECEILSPEIFFSTQVVGSMR